MTWRSIIPAINNTKTGNIGILATASTLKGEKYRLLVDELTKAHDVKLFEQACVGLVQQIEKGEILTLQTYEMLENWLKPMLHNHVDTIVLGCTHYPFVKNQIATVLGDIPMFDGAYGTGKHLYNCLKECDCLNDQEEGDIFYGSSKEDEIPIYKTFMNTPIV